MFTKKNKTKSDDVKAHRIENSNISELKHEMKHFLINKDKETKNIIVNNRNNPTFKFVIENKLSDFWVSRY